MLGTAPAPGGNLLGKLFDRIDEGVCVFDREQRVVYWNAAFLQRRGVTPGALHAGMSIEDMLSHAARFRVLSPGTTEAFARAVLPQFSFGAEVAVAKIEQENGVILRMTGQAIDAARYAILHTDITESERSALAYRDAATRLAATLDNVLDGIITIDDQGIIDSYNAGAERLLGYSAAEVVGRNIKLLLPELHATARELQLATYQTPGAASAQSLRCELEAQHKDGQKVPVELGVSQMTIGNHLRFIGVLRDITAQRRVERMQHEFLATASHELRTPLTSVIGSLGLLRGGVGGSLPAEAHRLIDIAHRNGERLGLLVNDLLDLELADSGQFRLALESLRLRALAAESVDANQAYATRFGVALALAESADDPACLVDRARLHQVLTNLIGNAVKFSPRASQVVVSVAQQQESAVIAVTDQGPGIPAAFRPHLFEKFARADTSDSRHAGGTGLGLSIARKLVDHMGGNIEVESVEGQGSTFRVRLPLSQPGVA